VHSRPPCRWLTKFLFHFSMLQPLVQTFLREAKTSPRFVQLVIDSKLRGCDLVRLQTDDVCVGGRVRDRATVMQNKTGKPVQFEITEQTRAAVQDWLSSLGARSGRYLFPSRFRKRPHISTRQYARIVHGWVAGAGLDNSAYGTHSMRRTKPAQIFTGRPAKTRSASQSNWSCEAVRSCGLARPAGP